MLVTVAITTLAWLVATFVTSPEPTERLIKFHRRVRPGGPGWKRIAAEAGGTENEGSSLSVEFANWAYGCVLIYSSLFGIGKLLFKEWAVGIMLTVVAFAAAMLISWRLGRESRRHSTKQRLRWD